MPNQIRGNNIVVLKTLVLYVFWLCLALGKENVIMSNKFSGLISGISMEMYLSHMVVFRAVEKAEISTVLGQSGVGYICTYLIVVILLVIGIMLYKKIAQFIYKKTKVRV